MHCNNVAAHPRSEGDATFQIFKDQRPPVSTQITTFCPSVLQLKFKDHQEWQNLASCCLELKSKTQTHPWEPTVIWRKMLQVLSSEAVATFCPSGLHTTEFTPSCSNFTSSVLEATSKTRQVSSEAVATFCPSGLHTTERTSPSCWNFTVLEATSKTRQVLSSEAVATFCPSGLHTTDFTPFSCWNFTSILEAKSNTRQVLSEAVATFCPSGLHTTDFTSFSCSNFPHLLCLGSHIKDATSLVIGSRGHLLPIWAPHYWLHIILMLKFHLRLGSQIKHAASFVRSRGHLLPIWAPHYWLHIILMLKFHLLCLGSHIKDATGFFPADNGHLVPIWARFFKGKRLVWHKVCFLNQNRYIMHSNAVTGTYGKLLPIPTPTHTTDMVSVQEPCLLSLGSQIKHAASFVIGSRGHLLPIWAQNYWLHIILMLKFHLRPGSHIKDATSLVRSRGHLLPIRAPHYWMDSPDFLPLLKFQLLCLGSHIKDATSPAIGSRGHLLTIWAPHYWIDSLLMLKCHLLSFGSHIKDANSLVIEGRRGHLLPIWAPPHYWPLFILISWRHVKSAMDRFLSSQIQDWVLVKPLKYVIINFPLIAVNDGDLLPVRTEDHWLDAVSHAVTELKLPLHCRGSLQAIFSSLILHWHQIVSARWVLCPMTAVRLGKWRMWRIWIWENFNSWKCHVSPGVLCLDAFFGGQESWLWTFECKLHGLTGGKVQRVSRSGERSWHSELCTKLKL